VVFVAILAISAYWDRSIVVLHVIEAVPYVAAAVLTLRRSTIGYALGAASGAFWLWIAAGQTTFVSNGFTLLGRLLTTGRAERWDVLIAAPAAIATGGMVVFSLWAYLQAPTRRAADLAIFAAAAALVAAWFTASFAIAAPRYLPLVRRAFGL
jgi:hypothetical protein